MRQSADSVRYRNDGEQFHYLWAARRCLSLLRNNGLVAIAIEGVSLSETDIAASSATDDGTETIDVAEYYGHEDISKATAIEYSQLKHSTVRTNQHWAPSALKRTIAGFSKYFRKIVLKIGLESVQSKTTFRFVSNRAVSADFLEGIHDLANELEPRHPDVQKKLEEFSGLKGSQLISFCKLLQFKGDESQYQIQRSLLAVETRAYLPDNDVNAPLRMRDLVTSKATSENIDLPEIRKEDVLRALGVTGEELFPAISLIEPASDSVSRNQESSIISQIALSHEPMIIHAAGGVGKTFLARRIFDLAPPGVLPILFDCFGNGQYRQRSRSRHRHKDAFVQISNDLASFGLCDPLIPSLGADSASYTRAFIHRLSQAVLTLQSRNNQSQLWLIIDAADNAEMAAAEFNDGHSFAQDILREKLPQEVKLVLLTRTERRNLLNPPVSAIHVELSSFDFQETAEFLRKKYPQSSDDDVHELHRLSCANPRVQFYALSQTDSLPAALRSLGPNPTTINDAIEKQLHLALNNSIENAGQALRNQIDLLCTGLAMLRPLVPIDVLSRISGAEPSTITSFATDFGRSLRLDGNALQFRDEPVETWFRNRFRATDEQRQRFVKILQPLASQSVYVATCLPYLMLEAGFLDELVQLALGNEALPSMNPVDKREVELQRLQFALKASIRSKRYCDAGKLAFKTGRETAGKSRQHRLFQQNTDLIAVLLDKESVYETANSRIFTGGWLGVQFAYEASLLSFFPEWKGDARSKLRVCRDWLNDYYSQPWDEYDRDHVLHIDRAEMSMAYLNVFGADGCARYLRAWLDRKVSLLVGKILARKLVDHARYTDLATLSISAGNDLGLLMAVAAELRSVHRMLPEMSVRRAIRLLARRSVISVVRARVTEEGGTGLLAIVAIVGAALKYQASTPEILIQILRSSIPGDPPRILNSHDSARRYSFLCAYTLLAQLRGEDLSVLDLANSKIREAIEQKRSLHDDRELRDFQSDIGALLPWHKLRAAACFADLNEAQLLQAIEAAQKQSNASRYLNAGERSSIVNDITRIWFEIILSRPDLPPTQLIKQFSSWLDKLQRPLYTTTWAELARTAARSNAGNEVSSMSYGFCSKVFELTHTAKEDSESKANTYILCARALLAINKPESTQYLARAIDIVSTLGDEVLQRIEALVDLADSAADSKETSPDLAFRFARCAEIAQKYIEDYFDHELVGKAICNLDPAAGLATISRWRDQDFGAFTNMLTAAILHLEKQGKIDPLLVATLIPFVGRWNHEYLLENGKMLAFG